MAEILDDPATEQISLLEERMRIIDENAGGETPTCRACMQTASLRHRPLMIRACKALTVLWRIFLSKGERTPEHIPTTPGIGYGTEFEKLRFWGLVQEDDRRKEDGGRSGTWIITERGVAFVEGRLRLPKRIWLYANNMLALDDSEMAGIGDAVGFDWYLQMRNEL